MSETKIPKGYKRTEVGIIPDDWEVVSFKNLFEFRNGVNADKVAYGKGIPFVNVLDVISAHHIYSKNLKGLVTLSKSQVESFSVRRGDILFNRTSETQEEVALSAVYISDDVVVFGGFVIRGRPARDVLDPIYSGFALRSPIIRSQIVAKGQGAIRANVGQSDLRKVLAPLPSIIEQRAIATALSDIDALIAGLDQLIAKKRDLKQAAMQQLLTGQKKLPGFQGKWKLRQIKDFTDCLSGGTPNTAISKYWGGEIRWMSSGELNFKNVNEVEGRISEEGLKNSSTKIIPKNCVLIGLAGQGKTRGTVAINNIELCTNQSIAAILPDPCYVSKYLFYNLDSRYDELRGLSTGDGGRGGLNLTIIRSLTLPFPEYREQVAIADTLTNMDTELTALEHRLSKTRLLKQGMMQELLTGKTRLV